jgi:hypothetical protein
MVSLTVGSETVSIRLSPIDVVLAVHGSLEVPLAHITAARVEDEHGWSHMWRKLWGTNAPGLKMAGTFYLPDGLAFLDYSSGRQCLVLDTHHERYRTIIVQPGPEVDVAAVAAEINARLTGR